MKSFVAPVGLFFGDVLFTDFAFGDPIEAVIHDKWIAFELVEGCSPFGQDPVGLIAFTGETFGSGEELALDGKGVAQSSIEHFDVPVILLVAGDVPDGKERVCEENRSIDQPGFADANREQGGSDL